jgi:hypothetical protein
VVTEITITNVKEVHEGCIDAIFEINDSRYGLIDWKTNDITKATVSGTDKWQLIANFLLANYRYAGDENNWSKCFYGSIMYYEGAYIPRLPLNEDTINKLKNDRKFAHEILCGGRPRAQKPAFCPVCDRENEGSSDCRFYREDSRQAENGNLPEDYAKIRSLLVARRYVVLDERGLSWFVIDSIIDRLGEDAALQELEKNGAIHTGYRVQSVNASSVTLVKSHTDGITLLEPRKIVRMIGKEEGNIPLLACVNEQGFVREVSDAKLVVDLNGKVVAERVYEQLSNLSVIVIQDEINLTRRVLEPMHRFHKLAQLFMMIVMLICSHRQNGIMIKK